MSFDSTATLKAVQSLVQADGGFDTVLIGEPKGPWPDGAKNLNAAIYMRHMGFRQLTLRKTVEQHDVTIRVYSNFLTDPTQDNELDVAAAVSRLVTALLGDYDLGATIEFLGPTNGVDLLEVTWGYVDVSGRMYRVADIAVPLVVDYDVALTQ